MVMEDHVLNYATGSLLIQAANYSHLYMINVATEGLLGPKTTTEACYAHTNSVHNTLQFL